MSKKILAALALIGWLCAAAHSAAQSPSVELEALLGNTAVLMINGQRQTMRVGQSQDGVTLVATEASTATVEIEGRTETIGLSQRVGTRFHETQEKVVTIARDASMQYQTTAIINGRSVLVLVDTGANTVALSAAQARAMNIDYSGGVPSKVETASGVSTGYEITLQSVAVGGIEVNSVPAMVLEGDYPATALLGMTFLRHVKMQESNGILSLSRSH
jgi:aspartyl protease family protein